MTILLPPAPIDAPFTSSNWVDWYEKVRRVINSSSPVDLASSSVTGVLPIIHGGTGTAVPALNAGTNIGITGTWPFNTIGISGILAKANGGNGTATPAILAGTGITLSGTWPAQTVGVTANTYVLRAGDTMTGALTISAGDVGIGRASIGAKLDVLQTTATAGLNVANTFVGAATTMIGNFTNQTDADFNIILTEVGAATKYVNIGPSVAIPMLFQTGNAEKMRLDSTGRLGINGVPTGKLTVTTTAGAPNGVAWDATMAVFGPNASAGTSSLALGYDTSATDSAIIWALNPSVAWKPLTIGANGITFNANAGSLAMKITSAGVIQDAAAVELGWKNQPPGTVTSGTLTTAERGRCVEMTAGITLPASVFSQGDVIWLLNTSLGAFTITQGVGLTLRLAGGALTGNRSIAAIGQGYVRYFSSTVAVIGGFGIT